MKKLKNHVESIEIMGFKKSHENPVFRPRWHARSTNLDKLFLVQIDAPRPGPGKVQNVQQNPEKWGIPWILPKIHEIIVKMEKSRSKTEK